MAETYVSALRNAGHSVTLWSRYEFKSPTYRLAQKFSLKTHFTFPAITLPKLDGFDLVHIHDHWSTLDKRNLASIAGRLPTFLTLHDCSAFTGGCLYPYQCDQYSSQAGCTQCPAARPQLFSALNHRFKRARFPNLPIFPSAPSHWMKTLADSSNVFATATRHIDNCVSDTFSPRLDPTDEPRPTVLIGTTTLKDSRKGTQYLLPILKRVAEKLQFRLLVFGSEMPEQLTELDTEKIHLGYIGCESELAKAYQSADAYLFPSVQDNAPLTVIESLRCATPVCSWKTGGTYELFEEGKSGWSAPLGEVETLADKLLAYLKRPLRERLATRQETSRMSQRFTHQAYASEHMKWYHEYDC